MSTYFEAKCHCGLNHFKVAFPTAKLPYRTNLCHCSSCRHATGQLSINDILIIGVPLKPDTPEGALADEPASLDGLLEYKSSTRGTRYSCKRCFAHFFFLQEGKQWWIWSGLLESRAWQPKEGEKRVAEIMEHIFIESTLDGGMADHLRVLERQRLLRHAFYIGDGEVELGWKAEELTQRQDLNDEALPFHCICKNISFKLKRPTILDLDAGADAKLVPGKTPSDPIRFHASHCVCTSCRLTCGSHVASWISVLPKHIIDSSTSLPLVLDQEAGRPGGLVQYQSSPGVYREACGACGASVFYWSKGVAKVDVCAGLVDEEVDGVRAERWLRWPNEVGYPEDAVYSGLVEALGEGLQATSIASS